MSNSEQNETKTQIKEEVEVIAIDKTLDDAWDQVLDHYEEVRKQEPLSKPKKAVNEKKLWPPLKPKKKQKPKPKKKSKPQQKMFDDEEYFDEYDDYDFNYHGSY